MNDNFISFDFNCEAVVVGNGDYPTSNIAISFLRKSRLMVCCDGAADNMIRTGYMPDLIIGDGDSISAENRVKYKDIICINPDQETNDQTKAVEYLAGKGYERIAIIGATGKREDHTLGNISLLMEYHKKGIYVRMYTDYGMFVPVRGSAVFDFPVGSSVSVFGFGTTGMSSDGLKYPIRDFSALWQGTLNVVEKSPFVIKADGNYMVYVCYSESLQV